MNQKIQFNRLILWAVLNMVMLLVYFYPVLFNLNSTLFTAGGDGLKNYYTYLYYIYYDDGTHFSGMNYPFGEHFIFTDNMPVLSYPINKLKGIFPWVTEYALGIKHLLIVLSYPLSSLYLYKTIKHFGVHYVWAVFSAVFIAYFAPQSFRSLGHFGLGLVCFLPMILYWLIQYHESKKSKYALFILLLTIAFAFAHVYHLAFTAIACACYTLAQFITEKVVIKIKLQRAITMLSVGFLPIAVFKLFLFITDEVTDRPKTPWGFLHYRSDIKYIFTSDLTPLGKVFQGLFGPAVSISSEGYVYIGFVGTITLMIALGYFIFTKIKSKFSRPFIPHTSFNIWLLMSIFAVLFSMGVPFTWGFEFLLDKVSVLRQFRSLGRFSWIFYYLVMVFVSILIFRFYVYLKIKKGFKPARIMLVVVALIWGVQLSGYAVFFNVILKNGKWNYNNFFARNEGNITWNNWLDIHHVNCKDYQAVVMLPYFHIGADIINHEEDDGSTGYNFGLVAKMSIQTGLPMMNVMMSRTSKSQTFRQVSMYDGALTSGQMVKHINQKPILILYNPNLALHEGEKHLLVNSEFIGDYEQLKVYRLDLKYYKKDLNEAKVLADKAWQDTRTEGLIDDSSFYYVQHFDMHIADTTFASVGALKYRPGEMLIDSFAVPASLGRQWYTFSFWMLQNPLSENPLNCSITQIDNDGNSIKVDDFFTKKSTLILDNWVKAEKKINIENETAIIKITAHGKVFPHYFYIDELLVRPTESIYFYKDAKTNTLYLNNRRIEKK